MHNSHSSDKSTTKIIQTKVGGGALPVKNKDWTKKRRADFAPCPVRLRGAGDVVARAGLVAPGVPPLFLPAC